MAGISGNNLGKRDGNQIESKVLNSEIIREIVEKIHQQYNLDFRGYADASLSRRIDHVIKIFGLEGPGELINKVSSEPDFKISLVHEITVGATEMFRDPSFWIALKSDILPALIQKEKIEVWIAGCSTGEEIFSLSIFLKENQLLERTSILSTDLDPIKLDSARKVYSQIPVL